MSRWVLVIGLVLVGLAVVLFWALRPGGPRARTPAGVAGELPTPTPAAPQRVMLLFPAADGALHPELRDVPLPEEIHERVRTVVTQLLEGPRRGLHPVAPYPARLLDVFVDGRGNAFVDLSGPPVPLQGSFEELALAYGIVDSVLLNCQELKGVQLLFDGREVPTLTGHLDLSKPLRLNKSLIAAR